MTGILKLVRVQIVIIVLFIFLKFIRPTVLASDSLEFFKIVLLSLPNLFEAIVGTLILTGIGLYLNLKILGGKRQLKRQLIYILAPIIAGIFVITQELKIHNLGGNNVLDKNDLLFSFIGLLIGFLIVLWIKPTSRKVLEEKKSTE